MHTVAALLKIYMQARAGQTIPMIAFVVTCVE